MVVQRVILCVVVLSIIADANTEPECSSANPCPIKGGSPHVRCPELVSKNGVLNVTLVVEMTVHKFEWFELPRRSFNGVKCPPTWRVKPGDTLNVKLTNNLNNGSHVPRGNPKTNVTNLHTHGLHISPLDPQDNVFVEVYPGQSHQYSYKIAEDHSPGTYWYHPHPHVATSVQLISGMAGILIIADDPKNMPADLNAASCPGNCDHDIPIIFSPMLEMERSQFVRGLFGDSLSLDEELEIWLRDNLNMYTVNGEPLPVISVKKNEVYRFRMLNAGVVIALELLVLDDRNGVAPCEIREIARDGVYLDRPTLPRMGRSFVFSGNRVDWLIKCTEAGRFKLYSKADEENDLALGGTRRLEATLATIEVTDEKMSPNNMKFPEDLPKRPSYLDDLRNVEPDQHLTIELGGEFTINREEYSTPTNYRYKVELGSVVEIQLVNTWYDDVHPMHFHINHAQVIGFEPFLGPVSHYEIQNPIWEFKDLDGKVCDYQHEAYVEGGAEKEFNITDPLKYIGHYERWVKNGNNSQPYPQTGEWRDTFYSPALSNLTLRMRMHKYTGPLVLHCHVSLDSDNGMMMVIEVVEKGGDLSGAHILSKGIYAPGSCRRCDWNRYLTLPPDCLDDKKRFPTNNVLINFFLSLLHATRDAAKFSPVFNKDDENDDEDDDEDDR